MMMPGRTYSTESGYRYGFNGKDNDNEVKGEGNQLDFNNRVYDPRLSKWLSTEPLQGKYPFASPYAFVLNNPISFVDPDGKDIIIGDYKNNAYWEALLVKTFSGKVEFKVKESQDGANNNLFT